MFTSNSPPSCTTATGDSQPLQWGKKQSRVVVGVYSQHRILSLCCSFLLTFPLGQRGLSMGPQMFFRTSAQHRAPPPPSQCSCCWLSVLLVPSSLRSVVSFLKHVFPEVSPPRLGGSAVPCRGWLELLESAVSGPGHPGLSSDTPAAPVPRHPSLQLRKPW